MAPSHRIRLAGVDDADAIARHRVAMLRDMGSVPNEALAAALLQASAEALRSELQRGAYSGWLAVDDRDWACAGAGVHVKPQLPRISPDGLRIEKTQVPLVVNVYTEPAWRRRGLARELMHALMQWATDRGFDRLLLHASDAGRPLYRSLGFAESNEMRWSPQAMPPQATAPRAVPPQATPPRA